jgi:peptide/nickel transport system substrate-binding protein
VDVNRATHQIEKGGFDPKRNNESPEPPVEFSNYKSKRRKITMKKLFVVMSVLIIASMILAACTPAATTTAPEVEATDVPVVEPTKEPEPEPTVDPAAVAAALPRQETLYFNGQQWGSVVGWNPYSGSMNNALAISQGDSARVPMFETPYLYNMLDGKQYPLLADGDYSWNAERTEITFKIKPAAKWSDGTPVTAEDVAYTWAAHVKYNTPTGAGNKDYIEDIVAVDAQTVVVKAKLDANGKTINPLLVAAYVSSNYVMQKAWTEKLEARAGGDATKFLADTAEDVVYSGPYHKFFTDDSKVVFIRDDNYWGQDASMWGKLPAPKYLAHTIFKDNAAGFTALKAGEVDVSQQFNANIQDLWLKENLPVSTYLPEAPYGIGASLPTAFYNLTSHGLDQVAVRKAIAMAVDYDTIVANAMTNQSATFTQVPRSLMNPTPGEQAMYDQAAVKDLQWAGKDYEGANKLLDDAGIVDSDGDGWREYEGKKLSYVATCPNGWSDWQAAIEVVAAAGKEIGIEITTNYPEWAVYQTVVTKSDAPLPEGYDIFMMWSAGAGPTMPWGRIRNLLSSEWVGMSSNWNGNWGQYSNPVVDELIKSIPSETDEAKLKETYTELVRLYLTEVPSFTLMYRPQSFHAVNESVWTNFPHEGDGTNPPVPPLDLTDGWSIAGLYNLTLVP